MTDQWLIMVVSSNLEARRNVTRMLTSQGFETISAASVRECGEVANTQDVALIFCDRDLSDGDYRDVLAMTLCRPHKNKARVVLISSQMSPEAYQEAKRSGVFDVISLPCRPTNLEWTVILAKRDERSRRKELLGIAPYNRPSVKSAAAGIS
ncbi:MAG TPA: response regulator [Candidatus Acidoferrales bacterium]|jgi:DNA-binding NtrC family response regulator|nr:response regulator [Candidatus Acidoferrales bacterium]